MLPMFACLLNQKSKHGLKDKMEVASKEKLVKLLVSVPREESVMNNWMEGLTNVNKT